MEKKIKYYRATLNYTYELTPEDVAQWGTDEITNAEILRLMKEDLAEMDGSSIWDNIETEIVYEEEN
jgi:hypothetical protein